jgi:hypothetical protein
MSKVADELRLPGAGGSARRRRGVSRCGAERVRNPQGTVEVTPGSGC